MASAIGEDDMVSLAGRAYRKVRHRIAKHRRQLYGALILDQQVPLQSVCRTLLDYDVTWYGEREFYDPDPGRAAVLDGLKFLSLQQIPQAIPRPYYYFVENAVISNRSVIDPIRPNRAILELYPDVTQLMEGKNWHFDPADRARALCSAARQPARFREAFIFSDVQWERYYHFLMDSCLRYVELERSGAIGPETAILFYDAPNRWQQEYLDLLGVPVAPDRVLPDSGGIRVGRLLVGSPRRIRFVCSRRSIHRLRDRLFERLGLRSSADGDRKVFISRGLASGRGIINEPEVRAYLEARGFETVALESMSAADQIRLFSEAAAIVAPHGGGLANMIFAANPRIVELLPTDGWDLGYYLALANQLGFDYLPIVSAPASADDYLGKQAKGEDFAVDLSRLRQVV
jgi:capsular polysaccharide biosynthesis protein